MRWASREPVAEPDGGEHVARELPPLAGGNAGVEEPVGDVIEQGLVLGEEEMGVTVQLATAPPRTAQN